MMARRPSNVFAMLMMMSVAIGTADVVSAQYQGTAPPGAAQASGAGGSGSGAGGQQGSTYRRPPQPTVQPAPAKAAPLPQGFSVVLVLGDIQASTGQDDVPVAARKALTDMKDFLPYKSYRLLDAAWVLCCGRDLRTTSLAERGFMAETNASGVVVTQLQGPESRDYELRLSASRAEGSRVFVKFSLREPAQAGDAEEAITFGDSTRRKELTDLKTRAENLEKQLQAKREVGLGSPHPDYRRLESDLDRVRARITDLTTRAVLESQSRPSSHPGSRQVIDTSFTMDLGETVVVGTSRLKAGSKALIALLTAVPPRNSRQPEEVR